MSFVIFTQVQQTNEIDQIKGGNVDCASSTQIDR